MNLIKSWIRPAFLILSIIVLFFATRIYNIGELPIFTDEAIYVRWAQIAGQDASWRFISLTDGKQPSFIWASMISIKLFEDPLIAARLVSVFSGFLALVGIYFLASEVFKNRRVGIVAAFLYVIYPFALVYDRMALYDSLVATFSVWALYFSVRLMREKRLDIALILGMVIGGGVLTKTANFFSIYLLPFTLILFDTKSKKKIFEFLKWISLALVSVIIAYGIYSILRLSPYFHIIDEKNSVFVYPLAEWINHPFRFFLGNINGLKDWLISYLTFPFILLVMVSFFVSGKKYLFEKLLLFAWFILPFVALALFGKVLYPRFILFMTMPLLVLGAFSLIHISDRFKNDFIKVGIFLIAIAFMLRTDYYILSDFAKAPIASSDMDQFVTGWSSGGGVDESIKFFENEARDKKIFIGTQGTFGLMPYAYEIYLIENPNIEIKGYWPIEDNPPDELYEISQDRDVYFVYYQPCPQCEYPGAAPQGWPLDKVTEYKKGNGEVSLSVYRFIGKE